MYEGMDLVLDEEFEEAIPKLEAVLAAEPTLTPVWSTLGWTYWRVGRQSDAVELWKKYIALDPMHPQAHLLMGNAFVGTGRLREAEIHLKRSLELDTHQIEPQLVLATLYRWTARYQASVQLLRELLSRHPDRMDIQNELGVSLFENGNYDEALPLLERAVRALPNDRELARVHARCLLRTGNLTEAQIRARRLLRDNDTDLELLLLLADAPRYNNDPAAALPYLQQIVRASKDERVLTEAHTKIIEIYSRLWEREPKTYSLAEAIESARALLEIDPGNPSWRQTHGGLLLMNRQYVESARQFDWLIDNSTTNVLAARNGLFEVGQATADYAMGRKHLDYIASINPANPFLHQMAARIELARGNMPEAYDALDKLEAAGLRGAVAVLQYGGLSDSDWSDRMSVRRFRLQMLALKQAGYRFLTPAQIAPYFASLEPPVWQKRGTYVPPRAVIIMFDQVDGRTLQLATAVANDLDLVFALDVPAGPVNEAHAGLAGIGTLREHVKTGRWVIGSMLYDAVRLVPVREDGRLGSGLANRIWLEGDKMYESELDFAKRVRHEYSESRRLLREWLGTSEPVNFVAYPYGEYGQGLLGNVGNAIAINLNEAAINYEIGFTQSVFGYAVNGDNPLMYQRYAPGIFDTGQDLIDHLAMHHPVFLARRMRAEFAALDGRLSRARENLEMLRTAGYPQQPYDRIEAYVYDHLALRLGVGRQTAKSDKGMFDLDLDHPFVGGQFDWFRDSLDRRNWTTAGFAGLYLTPVIYGEVRAGYGAFEQDYTVNLARAEQTPVLDGRRAEVTEKFVGLRAGVRVDREKVKSSPIMLNAGLERHEYRGDAEFDDWAYMIESAFRPALAFDVLLRFDHAVMPSARSLVEEQLAYDQFAYGGALRVLDWWDIWTRVSYFGINDGNERLHFDVSTMWELVEDVGLLAGLEYSYVNAKHFKQDYWTPYRLNQGMVACQVRNNFYRFYYDVAVKWGYAREEIRTEDEDAYERLVERGRLFRFDPGDGPESEWVEVFSANAALRMNLSRHLHAHWEGLYTESVNYHEYKTIAGLTLIF
jgi:tetratricopeptide (TPR) repeat protein